MIYISLSGAKPARQRVVKVGRYTLSKTPYAVSKEDMLFVDLQQLTMVIHTRAHISGKQHLGRTRDCREFARKRSWRRRGTWWRSGFRIIAHKCINAWSCSRKKRRGENRVTKVYELFNLHCITRAITSETTSASRWYGKMELHVGSHYEPWYCVH